MKKTFLLTAILTPLLYGCHSVGKTERLHVNKGKAIIAADESFEEVVKAQVNAYKSHYPETEFEVIYAPEQKAIRLMLSDSADIAVVSRELSADEQKYFTSRRIDYTPAEMAIDAVVLVVNKDFELNEISEARVASILKGEDEAFQLVFDNGSSSNLNFFLNHFKLEKVSNKTVSAAKGTEDVFAYVENHKKAIGVIGLNWISDEDDPNVRRRKSAVKILKVSKPGQVAEFASLATLRNQSYPFAKSIYLHTTQEQWGVAKGFVRFACSQIGQLVVEKMGLQPFYLIPKKYEMSETPEINVTE
ncbi:substrate-binding domain-containing protein [Marinilongibacter aquaticus]|uniref:PstS family phosphate ABC transporter substrate-binding protein n=1 Tax=Marinilongibacter aquaticus TaxID=2975157 RepID=UPI0021BDE66A|nr:substrate-binding domain-containing protein [Marinilongibacter aquaticus]UBM60329.1 substrate-binding domain-containing protein [Marinilongibacter aquaticus]